MLLQSKHTQVSRKSNSKSQIVYCNIQIMQAWVLVVVNSERPYNAIQALSCADPEGEQGVQTNPLKNHKNIGLLGNTGQDPLENHKATKPAFNVGPSSNHPHQLNKISELDLL